jgi:hypothetical protein
LEEVIHNGDFMQNHPNNRGNGIFLATAELAVLPSTLKKMGSTEKNCPMRGTNLFVGSFVKDSVEMVAAPSTAAGIVSLAPDVFVIFRHPNLEK